MILHQVCSFPSQRGPVHQQFGYHPKRKGRCLPVMPDLQYGLRCYRACPVWHIVLTMALWKGFGAS